MSIPMNIPLSVDGGVSIPLQVGEAVVTDPIVDPTLTISGAAADAKVTGDEIADLKSHIDNAGLTDEAKQALMTVLYMATYNEDATDALDDLYDALYNTTWQITNNLTHCTSSNAAQSVAKGAAYTATISADAGYTLTGATVTILMGGTNITSAAYTNGVISIAAVTGALVISISSAESAAEIVSISAEYTQSGTVYTTDSLDTLKSGLIVTATYDDTSTAVVPATDYTLSGTLAEGTQTITVSYRGMTDTFTVSCTVKGWLYHFNDSILSSGSNDFGFTAGSAEYVTGKFGKAYYHHVGTEGTASTDPLGLYALNSQDAPTWGANDFTIAGWQKSASNLLGHLFNAANYVGNSKTSWNAISTTVVDQDWTLNVDKVPYAQKYAGIRLGMVSSTIYVSIVNAAATSGATFKLTPPTGFVTTDWHHYALTRHGDTLYYFVDGDLIFTVALPTGAELYSSPYITVGNFMSENSNNTVTQYPYSAYYDDLYVCAGYCKWTESFDAESISY